MGALGQMCEVSVGVGSLLQRGSLLVRGSVGLQRERTRPRVLKVRVDLTSWAVPLGQDNLGCFCKEPPGQAPFSMAH